MDHAALVRVHRVERVLLAGALDPGREAHRQLAHLVLAARAVALHIKDDAAASAPSSSPSMRFSAVCSARNVSPRQPMRRPRSSPEMSRMTGAGAGEEG